MSEHQHHEFLAVDRPLDEADRKALRALSTRATITATRFVNTYQWGDFKGDPAKLMERCFDLHLYWANWGTRRLMLRLPKRFVDLPRLGSCLDDVEGVTVKHVGEHVVLDIWSEDDGGGNDGSRDDPYDDDESDDGSGLLADLAPLRADVIAGDLRLFYLLWLTALEADALDDDAPEPMSGIAPLTASLRAFAAFLRIDPDLVGAAAESEPATSAAPPARSVKAAIADLPDDEKVALLVRLYDADPHTGSELRLLLRPHVQPEATARRPRTVGGLRARAEALRLDRGREKAAAALAQRERDAERAERQRNARLVALASRGEAVWREIEIEIARRNASGYARATGLLSDLKALAARGGLTTDFNTRLATIRQQHAPKVRFIERLRADGL